jgi:hypothetical protein
MIIKCAVLGYCKQAIYHPICAFIVGDQEQKKFKGGLR